MEISSILYPCIFITGVESYLDNILGSFLDGHFHIYLKFILRQE